MVAGIVCPTSSLSFVCTSPLNNLIQYNRVTSTPKAYATETSNPKTSSSPAQARSKSQILVLRPCSLFVGRRGCCLRDVDHCLMSLLRFAAFSLFFLSEGSRDLLDSSVLSHHIKLNPSIVGVSASSYLH